MTQSTPNSPSARRPSKRARVAHIVDRAFDTRSLFLQPRERLIAIPGQFISISIPLGDEVRSRPYSIAGHPADDGSFEILFNRVPEGRGVAWLFDRAVGDEIDFIGPFGAFTLEAAPVVETVFIAEGTAIAPIRPMVERASGAPGHPPLALLHAAADSDHLFYRDEFEAIARADRAFTLTTITAPPDAVYERLARAAASAWIEADANRDRRFYICGVGKGVLALRDLLRAAGYERRAVRYEQW